MTERSPPPFNKHIRKLANPGHITAAAAVAARCHVWPNEHENARGVGGWGRLGVGGGELSLAVSKWQQQCLPSPPPLCLPCCPNQAVSSDTQQTGTPRLESTSVRPLSAAMDTASDACSPPHRCRTRLSGPHILPLCALRPSCFCLMPIRTQL